MNQNKIKDGKAMENGQRETDYRETANDDQINNGGYKKKPF